MSQRADIFGVRIDVLDLRAAAMRILMLAAARRTSGAAPAIVVTPNLDHIVRLRHDAAFRAAYADADVVLADGLPLVLASRLGGPRLPERVAGSDLVLPLCAAAAVHRRRVVVLGTTLEILSIACRRLRHHYPDLRIVGAYAPSRGFDARHPETVEALGFVNALRPDLLFVALGSPRQELWAQELRGQLDVGAVICVGAAFDFLADRPRRAPVMLQRLCLEWLWRLAHDPVRFARRYATNLVHLPLLLLGQLRRSPAAAD